ncbi:MAG: cytochrome c oxidase subunit 3 family protein [Sphingobacteriales bacterium]|nr:MAG: cytochrome c oxidase subunit 3 family protein [Sphingobacteriales bacterium]
MDPVASHLAEPAQRADVARLGMWLFLSTEVLFFGGMMLGYTVYRMTYPADFIAASGRLKVALGATNTLVLLTSSFFVALAVKSAQRDERRTVVRHLLVTLALAIVFLGIKSYEWYSEYDENLVPGLNFALPGVDAASAAHQQLFFCFYFIMTGIHGVHMMIGCGVIGWLILRGHRGSGPLSQTEVVRVESTALYWHFVDIVWVFLLPLLYLTGLG